MHRNRMIADPYTRLLVARDQVNQAAAVLIASTDAAQELGIDLAISGFPLQGPMYMESGEIGLRGRGPFQQYAPRLR